MTGSSFSNFVRPTGFKLSTTAETVVYTATQTWGNILMINIANTSGSAVVVSARWFDESEATVFSFLEDYTLPPAATAMIEPPGMVIEKDDEIRVQAGTANVIEGIISVAEIAGRVGFAG